MHYQWPDVNSVHVMGILNITPDSFSDGGRFHGRDAALRHAEQLCHEGADILDVGGESTRPGAATVSVQEEMDRVLPVLEVLRSWPVALSLDTRKAAVMKAGLRLRVDMINDVSALQDEAAMSVVAAHDCKICLMHMQGQPATMQQSPQYSDVVNEVLQFLQQRVASCCSAGITRERLCLDPGFGFGKSLEHNLKLLQQLSRLTIDTLPIMAGVSRKSLIGQIIAVPLEERLLGSVVLALLAAQNGARLLRVHDVKATRDALRLWQAVHYA